MSLKKDIGREIRVLEEDIKNAEIKRTRSQAAIIEALIVDADPAQDDVDFFRKYTAEVEDKRARLKKLVRQFEAL